MSVVAMYDVDLNNQHKCLLVEGSQNSTLNSTVSLDTKAQTIHVFIKTVENDRPYLESVASTLNLWLGTAT